MSSLKDMRETLLRDTLDSDDRRFVKQELFPDSKLKNTEFIARQKLIFEILESRFPHGQRTLDNLLRIADSLEVINRFDTAYYEGSGTKDCGACGQRVKRELTTFATPERDIILSLSHTCAQFHNDYLGRISRTEERVEKRRKRKEEKLKEDLEKKIKELEGTPEKVASLIIQEIKNSLEREYRAAYSLRTAKHVEELRRRKEAIDKLLQDPNFARFNAIRIWQSELQPDLNFLNRYLKLPHLTEDEKILASKLLYSLEDINPSEVNRIFATILANKLTPRSMTVNEIELDLEFWNKNNQLSPEEQSRLEMVREFLQYDQIRLIEALMILNVLPDHFDRREESNKKIIQRYSGNILDVAEKLKHYLFDNGKIRKFTEVRETEYGQLIDQSRYLALKRFLELGKKDPRDTLRSIPVPHFLSIASKIAELKSLVDIYESRRLSR